MQCFLGLGRDPLGGFSRVSGVKRMEGVLPNRSAICAILRS